MHSACLQAAHAPPRLPVAAVAAVCLVILRGQSQRGAFGLWVVDVRRVVAAAAAAGRAAAVWVVEKGAGSL